MEENLSEDETETGGHKPLVTVGIGERAWAAHRFEFEDGSVCKFLAKELKDGRLEVTMVWEHPWSDRAHRSCFVLSKDKYDEMVEGLAKTELKNAKHEVFYPQQITGEEEEVEGVTGNNREGGK